MLLVIGAGVVAGPTQAKRLNGFDLSTASIPTRDILRGGPPRDGIPALDSPEMIEAHDADWDDDEWVVGIASDAGTKAYPLSILVWHELVNDWLGKLPILVSYCPLCGSAMVFDRRLPRAEGADARDAVLRFGVSGLLYQSDLLMFDRESESLWSQITGEAVTGGRKGDRLVLIRSRIEPWAHWRSRHPDTKVLSRNTGHRRRYGRSPYGSYERSKKLYFPVPTDSRHHPKMRTLGLRTTEGVARAYPIREVEQSDHRVIEDFAGRRVVIAVDPVSKAFSVEVPADVEVIESYWFAWMAFHPDSSVYSAPR
jgi:hypothetical protein